MKVAGSHSDIIGGAKIFIRFELDWEAGPVRSCLDSYAKEGKESS
jgi:hypothetical protein